MRQKISGKIFGVREGFGGGGGLRQRGNKRCDVRWDCSTNQGNVLLYVGAVGQVGENGVHVLYVGDADRQISESGQRPQFVLILTKNKNKSQTQSSVCACAFS